MAIGSDASRRFHWTPTAVQACWTCARSLLPAPYRVGRGLQRRGPCVGELRARPHQERERAIEDPLHPLDVGQADARHGEAGHAVAPAGRGQVEGMA